LFHVRGVEAEVDQTTEETFKKRTTESNIVQQISYCEAALFMETARNLV